MRNLRCEKYNQDVDIDFHGFARVNLSSEHGEPGTRLRVEGGSNGFADGGGDASPTD